jgi:P27 family predicted phage terminase small subunit
MGHLGVIRGPDADILRCYCEAVSRYAQAARLYAGSGPLVRRDGGLVKNPPHQVIRDDSDQIRLFARELGLSPPARVGLQVEPEHNFDFINPDLGLPRRLRALSHEY